MVPYWHETKTSTLNRVVVIMRQWLLLALFGWLAGWQMMDLMLRHAETPLTLAAATSPTGGNG